MFSNFIRIFLEQGATTSHHTEIPMQNGVRSSVHQK